MFLIMSAAYVDQELKSEFGRIPPSFLPLGNVRLFKHQVQSSLEGLEVYLSLPESYSVPERDAKWLQSNNVKVVRTPEGIELGASLVAALNLVEFSYNSPLHVLFGDTLINPLPIGDDIVAISEVKDSYNWAFVTNDDMHWLGSSDNHLNVNTTKAVSGYFKFSQPKNLIKAITMSHWDFIEGLNKYHKEVGLSTVDVNNWLDFGHVNTYYRSKTSFTTQRAFNELVIKPTYIEKSSIKNQKIRAEANWYEMLPSMMRGYTPQYLGSINGNGRFSYRLEYLHHTALNELFVFAELPVNIWQQIIASCLDFVDLCIDNKAPKGEDTNSLEQLFSIKTSARLDEYCTNNAIDINQRWTFNKELCASLSELVLDSELHIPKGLLPATVLHGDFCFSNILYDFRTSRIKTIDPRGLTIDNDLTIYGDVRYDLAKLSHSILGMYDWIVAGYFQNEINDYDITFELAGSRQYKDLQQAFIELVEERYGLTALNLYAMQIQLFLSMLPLHADHPQRQQALLANAFRLHQLIKRFEQ